MMTSLHTATGRGREGTPLDLLRFLSALLSSMLEGPAAPPAGTWALNNDSQAETSCQQRV